MKLCFAAFILAECVMAQEQLKFDARPGLWETTSTTTMSGMPQIDTSKMPPEARKRVEESLKKNMGPRTSTSRSCMTKEKLQKDMFLDEKQTSCKRTVLTNTSRVAEVKVECTSEKNNLTGMFRIESLSKESVRGTFHATGTMNFDMNMTAKWISDNCGDLK